MSHEGLGVKVINSGQRPGVRGLWRAFVTHCNICCYLCNTQFLELKTDNLRAVFGLSGI